MNSKKVFFVMVGVVGLMFVMVIASVVLGDRWLAKKSNQLVNLKADNQVVETQQISLAQAKKDVQQYSELRDIAKQVVPQDKDQALATRQIVSLADQAGVKIASVSFPASNLGQAQTAAGSSGVTAPGTCVSSGKAVSQIKPVDNIKGLCQLDITVISDTASPISYAKLISFLMKLEQNRRTAQVSQLSIQPDSKDRTLLNFTLTITVYIKP